MLDTATTQSKSLDVSSALFSLLSVEAQVEAAGDAVLAELTAKSSSISFPPSRLR